ncbi:MAG: undecaprenyldiphospho-muramoylpentapeptide beta-N-acetylglucosaminyltransferase [Elusimicrobia bacterium]|nr:undecaprenyldiphospho-muramoylpentapeptide beta-N-acetylglucosaminyltransferase [Elusimicrobiota bacterium]
MKRIVITTGGTGGHIYPALVTAEGLRADGWEVLFVGRFGPARDRLVSAGFEVEEIPARGFVSKGFVERLRASGDLLSGIGAARGLLKRLHVRGVLGFGGYASVATILAARSLGIKTMLHEQNVKPGLANRILGRIVRSVAITFRESARYFPSGKTVWSGYPLRPLSRASSREEACRAFSLEPALRTLLVFGGSQGAQAINEALMNMVSAFSLGEGWQVLHATGRGKSEGVSAYYKACGIPACVVEHISDMAAAYAVADVVVARSGAGTVTELGVLGIPAVLVPYPFAGGHQRENARVLEQLHTAEIIEEKDLKGGILRDKIFSVLRKVSSRTEAQKALQKEIRLDAVTRLVDEVSRVFGF